MFVSKSKMSWEDAKTATREDGTLVFSQNDFDDENYTIDIHDCEQFINGIAVEGVTLLLTPTAGGFYFQNDPLYKEGCDGYISFYCYKVKPKLENTIVVLQGLQATGTYFFHLYGNRNVNISEKYKCYLENIYIKDCVHTKISSAESFRRYVPSGSGSNTEGYFNNCKLSMHTRTNDYGYDIGGNGITWSHCSRYIEYSDLTPNEISGKAFTIGNETTNACSTIIRNASHVKTSATTSQGNTSSTSGMSSFISKSTNSSWDIEFYRIDVSASSNPTYSAADLESINNCFISMKCKTSGYNVQDVQYDGFFTTSTNSSYKNTGVNVYNLGDSNDTEYTALNIALSNVVIGLTEQECKNYDILNKWGFFVNRVNQGD